MPERKCECGKPDCYTCHTREIRNRWRSKPENYKKALSWNRKTYRRRKSSEAVLEQRLIAHFHEKGWD